jgi:hypothetical protein
MGRLETLMILAQWRIPLRAEGVVVGDHARISILSPAGR